MGFEVAVVGGFVAVCLDRVADQLELVQDGTSSLGDPGTGTSIRHGQGRVNCHTGCFAQDRQDVRPNSKLRAIWLLRMIVLCW